MIRKFNERFRKNNQTKLKKNGDQILKNTTQRTVNSGHSNDHKTDYSNNHSDDYRDCCSKSCDYHVGYISEPLDPAYPLDLDNSLDTPYEFIMKIPTPITCRCPIFPTNLGIMESDQIPHFLAYYMKITDKYQHDSCIVAFGANFKEYKKLYDKLAAVSKEFSDLENKLLREIQANDLIACEVVKEYMLKKFDELRKSAKYEETRRKFNYTHNKLLHLKRLLSESDKYDSPTSKTS